MYLFSGVLLLFQFEYVFVEVYLQVLVGVVNAQLFETVFLEIDIHIKINILFVHEEIWSCRPRRWGYFSLP